MIDHLEKIKSEGFCCIEIKSESELIRLAEQLGTIVPSRKNSVNKVDTLEVGLSKNTRSLSAKYLDGAFPFHTDGAYLLKPPHYVILRSENEDTNCPTILCRLNLDVADLIILKRDVWFVNGGRGKFYSSICSSSDSSFLLRYDEECMRPVLAGNQAKLLMENLIENSERVEINWTKNLTVIIDNWRMLHSRADASNSKNRKLQRVWSL